MITDMSTVTLGLLCLHRVDNKEQVRKLLTDNKDFLISDFLSPYEGKKCTLSEIQKYLPETTHLKVRYGKGYFKAMVFQMNELTEQMEVV